MLVSVYLAADPTVLCKRGRQIPASGSQQSALLDLAMDLLKRALEAIEHLVDLRLGDDERRTKRQAVAHCPQDQALPLGKFRAQ